MRFQTILLDADGTLLDFSKTEQNAMEQCFSEYQIPLTGKMREAYHQINRALWNKFEKGEIDKKAVVYTRFVQLFRQFDIPLDGIEFENRYQYLLGQGHFLIPGALELCRSLAENYELYIVSNGVSSTQHRRLEASGLKKYMKDVFVSEDAGYQKPQKEFFDYVSKRIPCFLPSRSIIVGDSLSSDIQGGKNAGIPTCWYNPEGMSVKAELQPDFEIRFLHELHGILREKPRF